MSEDWYANELDSDRTADSVKCETLTRQIMTLLHENELLWGILSHEQRVTIEDELGYYDR